MDKYINQLIIQLSQRYKVNLIVIMSYSQKYYKVSKTYKLTISSGKEKIDRVSLDFTSKRVLVMEMMKWVKEQN